QPGDTGRCGDIVVGDTLMAASNPSGDLRLGGDIPVKRGEPSWSWYVGHRLAPGSPEPSVGQRVELRVDAERRHALSAAHTACHLAALAMNRATAHLWRKPVRLDSLGAPDLDQTAMQTSVMDVAGSTDVYRLGKSLRKKGFDSAAFADEIDAIVDAVQERLAEWVAARSPVAIEDAGDRRITALRRWTCELPEGRADLPCGGTHVADLGAFEQISVAYDLDREASTLTVRTVPRVREDVAP
ncbi:MAG TPA: metal-dependent hydrolase, partial [Actinomycetes bacterium]|nr:metal-dependent hydrolase [Actinomycetes bacterium]